MSGVPGRKARTPFNVILTNMLKEKELAQKTYTAMAEAPELFEVKSVSVRRCWYAPWQRKKVEKINKYYLEPLSSRKSWHLAALALQCAIDEQKLKETPINEALRLQAHAGPILLKMLAIMALPEPQWRDPRKVDTLYEMLADTVPPKDLPAWFKWYVVQGDFRPFVQAILSIQPAIDIKKPGPVNTQSLEGTPRLQKSIQSLKRTASKQLTKSAN